MNFQKPEAAFTNSKILWDYQNHFFESWHSLEYLINGMVHKLRKGKIGYFKPPLLYDTLFVWKNKMFYVDRNATLNPPPIPTTIAISYLCTMLIVLPVVPMAYELRAQPIAACRVSFAYLYQSFRTEHKTSETSIEMVQLWLSRTSRLSFGFFRCFSFGFSSFSYLDKTKKKLCYS